MHAVDHDLVVCDPHEGFLDAALAHTHRLYFRSRKGNTALELIVDKEVEIRFFIVRDQLKAAALCHNPILFSVPAGNSSDRNLSLYYNTISLQSNVFREIFAANPSCPNHFA